MYCKTCKKEKTEQNFHKGFTECKDCTSNLLNKFSNEVGCVKVKELLHKNNYIINQELLDDIFFSDRDEYRGKSNSSKLLEYLRKVNSLPQYKDYKYRVVNEERSDIEFINDDIEQLKKHIQKALDNYDFNAHNKWMNSLRDAIELRDKLQGNKEYVINIGTVTVDKGNADEFLESLIKLAKEKSSMFSKNISV